MNGPGGNAHTGRQRGAKGRIGRARGYDQGSVPRDEPRVGTPEADVVLDDLPPVLPEAEDVPVEAVTDDAVTDELAAAEGDWQEARKLLATDDIDMTRFPVIDVARGGSIQGEIDALNRLIALAIPPGPFIYEGIGTYVIPGHGRLCEQLDVVNYRDMVVIVRDVIADMIKRGMTLDQIKEASPAKPYETEYGTEPGSTNAFVETVYKSLTAKK